MKLLLLCLAFLFVVALAIGIAILIVHQLGLLDVLLRSALEGLVARLSGRPP